MEIIRGPMSCQCFSIIKSGLGCGRCQWWCIDDDHHRTHLMIRNRPDPSWQSLRWMDSHWGRIYKYTFTKHNSCTLYTGKLRLFCHLLILSCSFFSSFRHSGSHFARLDHLSSLHNSQAQASSICSSYYKMPAPPNYVFTVFSFVGFFFCLMKFPMQFNGRSHCTEFLFILWLF